MTDMIEFTTSGSTGTPKVIQKTKASLSLDAQMLAKAFHAIFSQKPTFISSIQTNHMYGKLWIDTLVPLLACPHHAERMDGWESFLKCQANYSSVVFITTPSFLAELVTQHHTFTPRKNVLAIFTAGSLLRPEVAQKTYELFGISPIEIYGSTETGSVAWRQQVNGEAWTLFDGVEASPTSDGALSVVSPFCVSTPYLLQDAVSFVDERHFMLYGRKDRHVKILEHFVSLTEVEEVMRKHAYVEDCYAIASPTDVARIWMLVVPSALGRAALIERGYQGVLHELHQEAKAVLPAYAVPRKVRFLRTLPYTEQGKLPVANLLPLFQSERQEPVVQQWQLHEATLTATFAYPADAIFFKGHFPNAPILPGVAQLFTVRQMIAQAFHVWVDGSLKRLKFQQPILPTQEVTLTVKRKDEKTFDFALTSESSVCASGLISTREEV